MVTVKGGGVLGLGVTPRLVCARTTQEVSYDTLLAKLQATACQPLKGQGSSVKAVPPVLGWGALAPLKKLQATACQPLKGQGSSV